VSKAILTIDTIEPERPVVIIDGNSYELAVASDFGLAEQARLSRLQKRVKASMDGANDPSDDDIATLQAALRELTVMLLPTLPVSVLEKLKDHHKMSILRSFSTAAGVKTMSQRPPSQSRTGVKSSRVSNVSTADVRKTG
jgi:hypothetical protein